MLNNNVSATPRPRPPARARRRAASSTSSKHSPPPPYVFPPDADDSQNFHKEIFRALNSPMFRRDTIRLPSRSDEWLEQKSREEVTELLLKADGLIREREDELTVTTAVCKSLYEDNLELSNKHKALLSRLPITPTVSPSASCIPLPLSLSPQYRGTTTPSISPINSSSSNLEVPRPHHHRRISVSPADIALLTDQNSELLAKLENLEADSAEADQAGRRKLRKLEKEIQGLKDELDRTRMRSEELEEKARKALKARHPDIILRRRREREDRARALRGSRDWGDETSEVKDYAPGGALSSSDSSSLGLNLPRSSNRTPRRRASELVLRYSPYDDDDEWYGSSPASPLSKPQTIPALQPEEYNIVSQLLCKVQELEEANTQITEQQARTAAQMQSVQRDAASIRRVYESLGDADDVEWHVVPDDNIDAADDCVGEHTIKFRSLRRSLDKRPFQEFRDGIDPSLQSTLRNAVRPQCTPIPTPQHHTYRSRKSVVGLFDPPRPDPATVQATSQIPPTLVFPGLAVPFLADTETDFTTYSQSSVDRHVSPVEISGRTLESELGSEFGDDWGAKAGNHHLRTSSLYDLTVNLSQSNSSIGSRYVTSPDQGPDNSRADSIGDRADESSGGDPRRASKIDALVQLDRTLSAPAASPSSHHSDLLQPGTWRGQTPIEQTQVESPMERRHRMSQTIRSRTGRWGDKRFKETSSSLKHMPSRPSMKSQSYCDQQPNRPPCAIPSSLANIFDSVLESMTGGQDDKIRFDCRLSAEQTELSDIDGEDTPVLALRSRGVIDGRKQNGITKFVLEIWLWLQFIVIIVVFLWAMAKQGPKRVLEEAERKRVGGHVAGS